MRRRFAPAGWLIGLALLLQQAEPLSKTSLTAPTPPATTTLTAPTPPATAVQQLGEFNVAQLQEYEGLRGRFDRDKILGFLAKRPWTVGNRLLYVSRVFLDTKNAWESQESLPEDKRTRGAMLNAAMAGLGPVSVKVGQTLSQRPDLVGEEACEALKSLQTNNRPFSNAAALQPILEAPLEKKSGTTFGPPGTKKLVYLMDDLNMPAPDKYGTQSAIALLRQQYDYGGF